MSGILEWFSGKRTYITAFLFGLFNFGLGMGWWTPDNQIIITVNSLLAMFGFGFLRAGVTKEANKSEL